MYCKMPGLGNIFPWNSMACAGALSAYAAAAGKSILPSARKFRIGVCSGYLTLSGCQSIEEQDRTGDQYQRGQGQEEVGQPAKLVFSHNLTAIADRHEINDHDRCKHTREYIGVEAQFDGVNAQQCESHAEQQRDGQHDVETLGLPGLLGETSGPAEGVSHGICTTG